MISLETPSSTHRSFFLNGSYAIHFITIILCPVIEPFPE